MAASEEKELEPQRGSRGAPASKERPSQGSFVPLPAWTGPPATRLGSAPLGASLRSRASP